MITVLLIMSSVKWSLQNIATNEVIQITKSLFKVGRHYGADIISKSSVLSRNHAVLLILIDGLYVQDNKSCNGTFINDKVIPVHEQRKLNPGDEVGFGWCTSKENANPCQGDPKPCIFRVLKEEPKEDTEPSTSTVAEIAEDEDDECIIISDDENDNPFACSQIFKISDKIKKESSFLTDSIDPYYEIKQELSELDYCENIAYDITEENNKILNDSELLRVLESQDTSDKAEKQPLEDLEDNESVVTVDVPGIHKNSESEAAKNGEETSCLNKAKTETKKKLTRQTNDNLKETENSLKNVSNKSETKKKHTKSEEHKKIAEHNNKKSQEDDKKTSEEQNDKILEEKKLTVVLNKIVSTKSKYVKPPIVKPHIQERRSSTNLAATTNIERKRKKSITLDANKKMKADNDTGALKNIEINKDLKNTISKERKRKLQELSEKNKPSKSNNKLTKNIPRDKVSESRGNFLLNKAPIPVPATSKVTGAVNLPAYIQDTRSFLKLHSTKSVSEPQILQSAKSTSEQHMPQSAKLGNQIQDMTITSNLSPSDTNASMPKEKVNKLETFLHQRPDSTVDDRPGFSFGNTIQNFLAFRSYKGGKHRYDRYYELDNIDAEIAKIIQWPVKWLQEQQNFDISPPVYGDLPPQVISSYFTNFKDYVCSMTPVVMLELWQFSFQTLYENNDHNPPKNVSLVHWRGTQSATYIDCEIQIQESELKNNIPFRVDDLIIVELILSEKQLYKYMAFGYIKSCNRTQTMNKDQHLATLKFMIVTKPVPKPIFGNKLIVKVIANIGGFLRLLKIMKYLEVSPLLQRVLHPVAIDYSFTMEPNVKNIISGMKLNKEQMQITEEATSMCVGNSPGFYLIKGPPGTGKSTVIVNIVLEILFRSKHKGIEPLILLTAPSNTAVDNLVLKLSNYRQKLTEYHKRLLKLVRVGPETSISKNVEKYKLASLARNNIVSSNNLNCLKEYKDFLKTGKDVDEFLRKHLKNRYYYEIQQAEHNLLRCSSVICTTLNSSVSHRILQLTRRHELRFTCAIIDEATQCNELESLLPLQLEIDKFVLVGDPQQLPAVVCNKEAQKLGFEKSLFSRITDNFNNQPVPRIKMLYEQYRMRPEICDYPNRSFYEGKLRNSPIIVNKLEPPVTPYLLFNLTSMKTDESEYINMDEVHVICKLLQTLRTNIKMSCKYTIGIITPYRAQKELLRKKISRIRFGPDVYIAVNTVDSFQGQENDIIIISCVRYSSNNFLQNRQRLNVALTRAKQALYIVGNYTLFKECRTFYDLREDAKRRKLCLDIGGDVKDISDFHKYIIR